MTRFLALLLAVGSIAGCSSAPAVSPRGLPSINLTLTCPSDSRAAKAAYVGAYRGVENAIPLQDLAQDIHCADTYKQARFPNGFVTIFGSSRIKPCQTQPCTGATAAEDHALYQEVYAFAKAWTESYGKRYPIMTGAGPGLMEAGSRGAKDGGGPSIGYTTYYDPPTAPGSALPYGGNPATALNDYVTEGLIFSSVSLRETAMIKHSAAIVLSPGGTGTEWEIFQILEMIKSKQLRKVGVYVFGDPKHWKSFEDRLKDFYARGVVRENELSFRGYASTAKQLVPLIEADLSVAP